MTDRVALYLQDAHPIREGMEHARYAEARGLADEAALRLPYGFEPSRFRILHIFNRILERMRVLQI